MDVPGCSALFKHAKAAQDTGDLKTAYNDYSKALSLLVRTFGTSIKFSSPDTIQAMPEGFSLLLQQTREVLSRLESIASKAKRMPSVSLPVSLPSTSSKPATRPLLQSRPSSSRSIRSATHLLQRDKAKRNIPLIPISPMTKLALEHNYNLAQVSQRLDHAKQEGARSPSLSASRDLAQLRRLIEDVRIQRAKVDAVHAQIQSVAHKTLVDWDADVIARQLTIIDITLFKKVTIPKDLVRHDRKHWSAQACIDFDAYLTHSAAHNILQAWDASRNNSGSASSATSPPPSKSSSNLPPPNIIAHLIRIAHILLHVYRNFNSFMAIMRTLTSPEIKRAHSVWSGVPSKTKDLFRKLVVFADEHNYAQQYREALRVKLDAFQDVGRDALVAVPWMRYHQEEVKAILHSYMTGHETRDGSTDVVLSAPGARKLSAVTALLIQCRSNEANQDDLLHPLAGFDHKTSKNSSNGNNGGSSSSTNKDAQQSSAKSREPVSVDGLRHALTPIVDLASLGNGDAALHHWLLTRPYLDKQQLIDESLEIEPLANGEELPCVSRLLDNEDDNNDDSSSDDGGDHAEEARHAGDESFEHVAVGDLTSSEPLIPLASSKPLKATIADPEGPVSDEELNAIMDELLGSGDLDDDDALFGDDNLDTTNTFSRQQDQEQSVGKKPRTMMSSDLMNFLGINPAELSPCTSDDEDNGGGGGLGPLASVPSKKDKGKERVQSQKEVDEELFKRLNNLTQKSRVLIQESHTFQQELEEGDLLKGRGSAIAPEEEDPLSSANSSPWPVKKFEPMTQGSEQDQLRIDDTGVQGKELKDMTGEQVIYSPVLSGQESPPAVEPAFSSLDALRRQLELVHKASTDSMARLEEPEILQESISSKDDPPANETDRTSPLPASSFDAPSIDQSTDATPFPSKFVSSSNPFAQYVKPPTLSPSDEPATTTTPRTEPVRTLRTKRSRVVLKPGESTESMDHSASAAAAASSTSLHSFGLSPPTTTEQWLVPKDATSFSPPRLSDSIANPLLASEEERLAIQERARLSLASHAPMSKTETPEKSMTPTMPDLQIDSTPSNEDEPVDAARETPSDSGERKGRDNSTSPESSSPLSPATSPEGARSPSRGRQRRRIAGGMVSLPTPSKTLTSLSTTSNVDLGLAASTEAMSVEADMLGDRLIVEDEPGLKLKAERHTSKERSEEGAQAKTDHQGGAMAVDVGDEWENSKAPTNKVAEENSTSLALLSPTVPTASDSVSGGGSREEDGLLAQDVEDQPAAAEAVFHSANDSTNKEVAAG
ncbi:hypothetical protein BGZ73_007260 [Actinomortierella ambigua]|nr:hypothetical protein BGZ73_007260 [Actinomortierella ambigua]